MSPRSWLASHAAIIVGHLRDNGFDAEQGVQRQVLNLAEEVGEFVGAYRRFAGHARRSGSAEEMHRELADVVITAYVTAEELGIDLDAVIHDKLQVIYSRGWREQPDATDDEPLPEWERELLERESAAQSTGDLREQIARRIRAELPLPATGRGWGGTSAELTEHNYNGNVQAAADAAMWVATPLLAAKDAEIRRLGNELSARCTCRCDGDPIECDHEAARGQVEEAAARLSVDVAEEKVRTAQARNDAMRLTRERDEARAEVCELREFVEQIRRMLASGLPAGGDSQ